MKIITFYLPQFHQIPENDAWWGKGFTEWVNMKKAVPFFKEHYQPRIPLDNNYYNLLNEDVKKWQVDLAKEYGIYAFCFYHYWFDGKLLLEKPLEQFLKNKDLNLHFCICWANEAWRNTWAGTNDNTILFEQCYAGEEDWSKHIQYLLSFFQDKRYICEAGKPLLVIYNPEQIPRLKEMTEFWNSKAIEHGFNGIDFAFQQYQKNLKKQDRDLFKYDIEYQPNYATINYLREEKSFVKNFINETIFKGKKNFTYLKQPKSIENISLEVRKKDSKKDKLYSLPFLGKAIRRFVDKNRLPLAYDYDEVWQSILKEEPVDEKSIPGAFINWDNTPRKANGGSFMLGFTPEKFERYLTVQIRRAKEVYHKDMIFFFAWNEWAEGGYLEPDEKYRYQYLEAIKKSLQNNET